MGRELRQGDAEQALAELDGYCRPGALRVADRVVRACRASRALSEEAVQEGFVRLLQHRHRVAEDRSPVPYFLSIVRRAAIDLVRRENRQRRVVHRAVAAGVLPVRGRPPDPVDDGGAVEVLGALPAEGRDLLTDRYVRERGVADMADERGVRVEVVYRRLHKYRSQARKATMEGGQSDPGR